MSSDPETTPLITLRPESAEDEAQLYELYADTRAEELAGLGWDSATRTAFLTMQFRAQRQGYRNMFPQGAFSMIVADGRPIGRIVVNRNEDEIRVVDIVLQAPYRGRGIGTRLLAGLCAEAAAGKKPLRLHVLKDERAKRLYERLGFNQTDDMGMYEQMEWRASD
jgi:GNAT superfamily N-acetyltransferase